MKIKSTLLAGLLFFAIDGTAQVEQNWIPGELLIQLDDQNAVADLEKQFTSIGLTTSKLLSAHLNIWQFQYDATTATIEHAIQQVYGNTHVITAQRNHILTNRVIPNDTEYDEQWQYEQANDRDIDAPEAWDLSTGGLTANGDTIVICVIDDGVNFAHPDLIPNLWRNFNEIPGNGLDDDGNGYVDDVRGWNAYDDNDNVAHTEWWEGHGSAVAGIVGAKGNDGAGVTGVNWDVKVMVVKGGGAESQALAAYSYVLENRKLYNETGGERGAFVVGTNASWGVDYGQADEAPLWCAMYDTLGNYGVLSCGATINGDENVDVVGDLPTQCASEFLITVTNTNITDNKVGNAGYGSESIDLGAPGAGTWTVDQFSNGFDGFGGTSGATPHVTGTIGLMYAIECEEFASLAIDNPKLAAEKVRDYILAGVDPNTSLDGITVTGGRLNVHHAVRLLAVEYSCAPVSVNEEVLELTTLSVYPNPVLENTLNVNFTAALASLGNLTVTDMDGKLILTENTNVIAGENYHQLQLPEMAAGIYNLTLTTASGTTTIRFNK